VWGGGSAIRLGASCTNGRSYAFSRDPTFFMQDQSSLIIELRTGRNGNLHKRLEAGHQLLPMVAAGKGEFAIIFASGVIKWQNFRNRTFTNLDCRNNVRLQVVIVNTLSVN
jgi:hypothetical protein